MNMTDTRDSLVNMFEKSVAAYPDNEMFGIKGKDGKYHWTTYRQVGKRVDDMRAGLAALRVGKEDCVGIISGNRAEWAICAFATYGLGARFVPMYEAELERFWRSVLLDSGAKVLLVSNREIYEKVRNYPDDIPSLERIIVIDAAGPGSMVEVEKRGSAAPVPSVKPEINDAAVLMYTSGTTGDPKGVLLSHGNLTSNAAAGYHFFPELCGSSRSLSILPWAHSYGQTAELYNFIQFGGGIGFMESLDTIVEDMGLLRPTHLIAVPRVFNKVYAGLWQKMDEQGGLVRKLFVMGVDAAKRRRELAGSGESSFAVNLKYRFADSIVFRKIRKTFGGRILGNLTASATMNQEILGFFWDVGIPIYDCYGLTETSPAVTMNCPTAHRAGSVGRVLEFMRVEIDRSAVEDDAGDGEIIVYGPNVMLGYHNRPEETKRIMTEDGGLRTGDRGRFDEDGYLYITGRIKEQYKLENGKYVFPAALEEDIKLIPCVESAVVCGEGRPYNVCLVYPNYDVLKEYALERELPTDEESLSRQPEILELIKTEVTGFLEGKYGRYEIPQRFAALLEDLTIENGLMTQTMKPKRIKVLERYKELIEGLYLAEEARDEEPWPIEKAKQAEKALRDRFEKFESNVRGRIQQDKESGDREQ